MSDTAQPTKNKRFSLSSSSQMLLALGLGIVVGLFFGESVAWMGVIGKAVILLMQMTVYPYIVVSLVGGIGKLNSENAALLFKKAGVIMLSLWALGMVVIFVMPALFPTLESASFFSTSSIAEPVPVDYYKLYIPSNPFESMADGSVPAMVLFCIAMGLALMGMDNKDDIISFMDILSSGLARVTQGLLLILPYGIFAMSASAAGTMGVEEFASLQIYLISMFILCMVLTFWVFPWVIAVFTPVPYTDVVRISRTALVTAFATGNVFIVLPVIVEECKSVLAKRASLSEQGSSMIDILVPIAYSFPNVGKLTVILFVSFAGWFAGKPIDPASIPSLAVSGFLSLFGSVYVAIPFMLDLVYLPADLFQFFVMSGFLTGKVSSMVAVMNLFALTLLSIAMFQGISRFNLKNFIKVTGGIVGVLIVVIVVGRLGMGLFVDQDKATSEQIANMRVADNAPTKVSRQFPVVGETPSQPIAGIKAIKERGVLRVGYRPSNVPFSYYNNRAELVGYDVALATQLAKDLGVEVEFIPFKRGRFAEGLDNGFFDIAMSGLIMSVDLMQQVNFSRPVMELTRSLVVADHRVKDFDSPEEIKVATDITVAYVEDEALVKKAMSLLPNVTFEPISNYKRFFKQKPDSYDALLISAEAGSAWTLFYPEYGVAIFNRNSKAPSGYAVAWENPELLRYVDNWIKLKKVDGTVDKTYRYWILGEKDKSTEKRWSIMKDVLGWVE